MASPEPSTRSSRASTPADDDDDDSPAILSPRSRLQKLLAPFDDDSDDETPIRPIIKPITTSTAKPSSDATRDNAASLGSESDDEEDDVPMYKPRGRMAQRMAGAAPPKRQESESSEDEDVYQRIRRDLMAAKKDAPAATDTPPQTTPPRKRLLARTDRQSTPASVRSESPGLFMSPAPESLRANNDHSGDSDSDLPDVDAPSRLRELVNRRHAERLAKEQAERETEEERAESGQAPLSDLFNDEDHGDEATERRLTQHTRPARRSSKRALEEMNRETQRMKRNMQLTHQAKVKKRFTPQDFLSSFSRPKTASRLANVTSVQDITSSSPPPDLASDSAAVKDRDTPPSSPPSASEDKTVGQIDNLPQDLSDDELPTLEELATQPRTKVDKGKAPAYEPAPAPISLARKVRIVPPKPSVPNDPEDDLQIIPSRFAMFDEITTAQNPETKSLLLLRHLANIAHPERVRLKKGQKPSVTPAQLEFQLRQRARDLANQDREQRLADLRAKGIVVMTEEEREREQLQIEDMLAKARQEADDLRKKEKASAKAAGETDGFGSSDESEDGDYAASDEEGARGQDDGEDEEEEVLELSGSEDEDNIVTDMANGMIDLEAGEQEDQDEPEKKLDEPLAQDEDDLAVPLSRRMRRKRVIEDEEEEDEMPLQQVTDSIAAGINDELAEAFGFGPAPPAPLGMSQLFAGTMAESQTQADTQRSDPISQQQDSLEMLHHIPSAPIPSYDPDLMNDTQDAVADSQTGIHQAKETSQQVELNFTQPALDSPAINRMSQFSDIPDPSQDVGLGLDRTPLARAAAPPSTADTVMLGIPDSPVVQRRGRLLRRSEASRQSEEIIPSTAPDVGKVSSDAFSVMRRAAKKPIETDFDKKKSNAKTMVDEQAEESEDEYAGLGGASDDESGGEADEMDKQMIDESDVHVDEHKMAAYFAEKSRAQDEAQTSKLYKDLMSGALRRNRGNAFELDSDEDDQIVERRRRKQREEARKRRLLLQDETVGKLGGNEKKEAFLRAIEDRDEVNDLDLLDGHDVDEDAAMPDSQPTESQQQIEAAPLAQVSGNALKRTADAESEQPRKKSSLRRNQWESFRKPKSILEVRESVSFLIEEPNAEEAPMVLLSDSEHEDEDTSATIAARRAPAAQRRVPANPIIDRLTLKKQSSSTAEGSSTDPVAFAAPSTKPFFSFKAPSLLRKATTNGSTSESMPPPALNREDSAVRRGGSKKSSINYQAREAERRVVLERAERKRADDVKKIAGLKRRSGALGMLSKATGGFE